MRHSVLRLFQESLVSNSTTPFRSAFTAIFLFDYLDRLRAKGFPKDWFNRLEVGMGSLKTTFDFLETQFDIQSDFTEFSDKFAKDSFECKTGQVYFNLFKDFTQDEYFSQTYELLKERFQINEISIQGIETALDDGCGGGRYTLALRKLGIPKVTGIDISSDSIAFAQSKSVYSIDEVRFVQGSVLELPFENESFDFVFSNGVLHHTTSTEKGLSEVYRVLKKNHRCWLYLYGGKESLFWDIVDFCRDLLKTVPQTYTQSMMKVLGYPPGRIFHRNDFFYVPLNRRYFARETEKMISEAGFCDFKRLKRGVPIDWDEIIYQNAEIDPYIYGEGEMRYLLRK